MKTIFLPLFVAALFLATSLTVNADHRDSTPLSETTPGGAAQIYNLRDFGAVGDGVADDGPALQRALDAVAGSSVVTLYVPAGRYLIATPVTRSFSYSKSLMIRGDDAIPPDSGWGKGLSSEFVIKVGKTADALTLKTLGNLTLKNIGFTGVPKVINDAKVVLFLSNIRKVLIQTCEFYGLSSQVAGGAIVYNYGCDLKIQDSAFLGCSTNLTMKTSVVHNVWWKGISVTDTNFIDYGERTGFFSKTPYQAPFAWLGVGNAASLNGTAQRTITVQDVTWDEGAISGINVNPELFKGPSHVITPIDLLYISRLYQNISQVGVLSWGNIITNVRQLFIEDSRYVWSRNGSGAIRLSKVDNAIIDLVRCTAPKASANRILADNSVKKLTVINSIYEILKSDAEITDVIKTDDPADDPAQFVRQRYIEVKGRGPNPVEHFYWTDQILQCGNTSACVAEKHLALARYLTGPLPRTYTIRGQVKNPSGQGIAGVKVWLNGSRLVSTQTDSGGNYIFPNLPIRGHYTVTPLKEHYSFVALRQTFITFLGDHVANFTGTERTEPTLISLVISPKTVGGNMALAKVTISAPALSTGAVITLSDTNPAATMPADVKVPAGATYATFPINTSPVSSITSGTVTATLGGDSKSVIFDILPVGAKTVALNPNPAVGQGTVTGVVTLQAAAPGNVTVTLKSANPSVANPTVQTLTIPAGQETVSFNVTTADVTSVSYATITATANGVSKSVRLTVNPK